MPINKPDPDEHSQAKVSAICVANEFLELAGKAKHPMSLIQLNRLVYFAHGQFYGTYGEGMVKERFEAWHEGPVVPELYEAGKALGFDFVAGQIETDNNEKLTELQSTNVLIVWSHVYIDGTWSKAMELEEDCPWWEAYRPDCKNLIDEELIEIYYKDEMNELIENLNMPWLQH